MREQHLLKILMATAGLMLAMLLWFIAANVQWWWLWTVFIPQIAR